MRSALLLALFPVLACCGDESTSRLVSADSVPVESSGCVLREARTASKTWLVRDGDSLRRIARRVYGDERLWRTIRDANPGKVASNGAVAAGVELAIPFDGI